MNYNANPGWTQLSRVWDVMYGIIENANLVIDGINNSELIKTKGDDCDMMLRFRAEAKVLRAMIYFDLIRLFGDIPFATGASDSNLENVYVGKTDRDVIMEALIGDLEESIPLSALGRWYNLHHRACHQRICTWFAGKHSIDPCRMVYS